MGAFKDSIKEEVEKYQQSVVEEVKQAIVKAAREGEKSVYLYLPKYDNRKAVTSFLDDEDFEYEVLSDDYIDVSLENL